jgi:hypothetical protein
MNSSNGSSRILVRGCRHRASVKNYESGLDGGADANQSAFTKLALDGGAIGLGSPASEVLNVEA